MHNKYRYRATGYGYRLTGYRYRERRVRFPLKCKTLVLLIPVPSKSLIRCFRRIARPLRRAMSRQGVPATCSWRCEVGDDADSLDARVRVLAASCDFDGSFERAIETFSTSGSELWFSGEKNTAKTPCEVVVPIPPGNCVRAVAVISGARTVELYAVRAPSYDRGYVKTVRASVVTPNYKSMTESPNNTFECVAALGSVSCVALVVRLFVPLSNGESEETHGALKISLSGIVVELTEQRNADVRRALESSMALMAQNDTRNATPATSGHRGNESNETFATPAVPMGSPLRLDALASVTRDVAGLPFREMPGTGMGGGMGGMSSASAAAMVTMLRSMTNSLDDAAAGRFRGSNGNEASDNTQQNGAKASENLGAKSTNTSTLSALKSGTASTLSALSQKMDRIESLVTRMERGVFAAFDRLEKRVESLEVRFEESNAIRLGGDHRPPKAHTKLEWDAGIRDDVS